MGLSQSVLEHSETDQSYELYLLHQPPLLVTKHSAREMTACLQTYTSVNQFMISDDRFKNMNGFVVL